MSDTDPRRDAAIHRLKAKRDLRTNLVSYVVVNAFLVLIWAATGANFFWPIFIIGGWGFGLAMHAWTVYGQKPITEEDVTREMERRGGDVVE
ncbi:2TM domain-containing protein [Rhabdothermincola sediminis]|uniref:2TM domain-containing protein n=1 Tax=Rhabdothermincola sediminis TaxID=2751370 RepID=UPI001AA021F3|nr:2TM domain-containing protein [Rhabdothermincola sediminis]